MGDDVVVDVDVAAIASCSGAAGSDALEVCFASRVPAPGEPAPACTLGVTGTLDGQPVPDASIIGWSGGDDGDQVSVQIGSYRLRLPLPGWSAGIDSRPRDFSGGFVVLERETSFDAYCVAGGPACNDRWPPLRP